MSGLINLKFLDKLFASKKTILKKEILTQERSNVLLGDYINHVVMYNFDSSKWNRDYYLWHRVLSSGVDCGAITIISDMKRNHYQKTLRKYIKQSQKAKNR